MKYIKLATLASLILTASTALAWNHGISIGYGGGSDINHHTDTNSGGMINGEFTSLTQRDWVNVTLNGSVGQFHSTAPTPAKNLTTAALSVAFRFYPFDTTFTHPFLLASVGPSYLSNTQFGRNFQATNFAFQSVLGAGLELGQAKRVDLNLRCVHYSNAYTMHPNQGFNIFYIGSIGYLFG